MPTTTSHDLVQRALYEVIPRHWGIYQTLGTAAQVLRDEGGNFIPAAAAELIVEITSRSNAAHDRIKKAAGYAQAGVPLYLLIDGWAPGGPTITLYGEPQS